ncbi:MAG: DUF547 domain-containing protein, partial [Erythrobacter sp.]|nr:DUF547 domain-containing protein [Erythrobacter sp.]
MTSALPANAQEPGDQAGFEQFVPSARVQATSIDYTVWDDALKYMVFR